LNVEKPAVSAPAGGETAGHAARQPAVQTDAFAGSALNVYTGSCAKLTKTRLPPIVAVGSVVVAAGGCVGAGPGIEPIPPPDDPPPPLHPAKSAEANTVKASDLFFMLEECDGDLKEF
jgi:hypothetical protein